MSYAPSFYAGQQQPQQAAPQKPEPEQFASEAAIPASTPIAEDALSPTQIQEAIRLYRNVMSNSTPSSPVRPSSRGAAAPPPAPAPVEVHSNYYGGGPVGVPQSYLMSNLGRTTTNEEARFQEDQRQGQQLMEELEMLRLSREQEEKEMKREPVQQQQKQQQNGAGREDKDAARMYGQDESGYCFNRQKGQNEEFLNEGFDENLNEKTPEATAYQPIAYTQPPVQNVAAPVRNLKNLAGPSEYIGMANDNRFIYDSRQAPPSYSLNYQTVAAPPKPVAQVPQFEITETTTTEDVTQLPGASPMVASRFRGLIKNVSTPTRQEATTPIVVERVYHQQEYGANTNNNNNNFGAFAPIGQPSESEYQLPVLNDLASCIENY